MHHPFTDLVLKLVNDPAARDEYLNKGTLPAGCAAPTAEQAKILRPAGDPFSASADEINIEIDKEWAATGSRSTTVVAAASASTATTRVTEVTAATVGTAVPQVSPGPRPNWPSRP